jgi:cadmium resistance protein CadD (predicted permease)
VAIVEIIGLGIVAFVATNIDDLFILMVLFARHSGYLSSSGINHEDFKSVTHELQGKR